MAAWEHNSALARIKTAMIEKKMTQAELADAADCHEKTIQNLLNGRPVRDQTLFDVCMVLGLDFEAIKHAGNGRDSPEQSGARSSAKDVAPVYMGAYTRPAVEHYIGSYLTLRPSFSVRGAIMAYRTDVSWEEEAPGLLFQERDRADAPFSHRGHLYIPATSMHLYLVSLTKGAMRMVIVSQLDRLNQMRGIITTLHKQRATLVPVSAPIIYVRRDPFSASGLGEIKEGAGAWREYKQLLAETVESGYARLVSL